MHLVTLTSLIALTTGALVNAQDHTMGKAPVNIMYQHPGSQLGSAYEFEMMPTRIMDQANLSSGEYPVKLDSFY